MESYGKNEKPYRGCILSIFLYNFVPIFLYIFLKELFVRYQIVPEIHNTYAAMMFGFGVGSLVNLSTVLAGALTDSFNHTKIRIKNFFENVGVLPFKYTMKAYFDDLKTYGVVFWVLLFFILLYIGLAIYGFVMYFSIYTGVL